MLEKIRRFIFQNLAFGFLAFIPIFATIYVFVAVLNFSDNFLFNLLPPHLRPYELLGMDIPGLGILLTIIIICSTGALTRNFFGRRVFSWVERLIQHIPLVGTFYNAFRQLTETLFMDRKNAFRKVVMIEFPIQGIYTVAFVTHSFKNSTKNPDAYKEMYTVFVPTTPNPTSGFFMIVPDWAAQDLDLSVQEAFRLIVSGGLLAAGNNIMPRIEEAILDSVITRKKAF